MPRSFTGFNSRVALSAGAVGARTHGGCVLICRDTGTAEFDGVFGVERGAFTPAMALLLGTGNKLDYYISGVGESVSTAITLPGDGAWYLVAAFKDTGTVAPRFHRYSYATDTWLHDDGTTTLADAPSATATSAISIGAIGAGSGMVGEVAAAAYFMNRVLTDAQVESLAYSLQAWLAASPTCLWVLDQSSTSQKVLDWTGGGANETSASDTSVATTSVPVLSYGHPVMMDSRPTPWLNASSGVAARNGTTSHTIPFGFTSTSGSLLVVIVFGAVTHSASGWTERLSPVNTGEMSVFTKTSTGEDSITVTHNGSNYPVSWAAYEYEAGSTWTAGVGDATSSTGLPELTGLPGTEQVVTAAYAHVTSVAGWSSASSVWPHPWVEDSDSFTAFATTDGAYMTVAHQINVTASSITPTITPTFAGTDSPSDREKVVFAIALPSGGGGPATLDATGTQASTSTLSTTGFKVKTATGTQASTSTLSTTGFKVKTATGTQASTSTLSTTSFTTRVATGTQASTSTLIAEGEVDGQVNAAGTQASTSTLTSVGFTTRIATGTQASTSTLTATGTAGQAQIHNATGTQAGVGALTGAAVLVPLIQPHVPVPGWGGLISVLAEARTLHAEDRYAPPVACPNDGEPLESGPDGTLHCRFDGWTWSA